MEMEKEKDEEINLENSSEDQNNDDDDQEGMGRSFECNFCKRGFTNAQALGGHMNIHRKDKSKSKHKHKQKQPSHISQKLEDFSFNITPAANLNYCNLANPSVPNNLYALPVPQSNYYTATMYHPYDCQGDHRESASTHLSLQIGSSRVGNDEDDQKKKRRDENADKLDLELRLGHI